jgi:hypothetical protein
VQGSVRKDVPPSYEKATSAPASQQYWKLAQVPSLTIVFTLMPFDTIMSILYQSDKGDVIV